MDAPLSIAELVVRYAQSDTVKPHDGDQRVPGEKFEAQIQFESGFQMAGGTTVPPVNSLLKTEPEGR